MLDKFICHFRVSVLFCGLYSVFLWKILIANTVDPDQMPPYVVSDLDLHCLPVTQFPSKNGLKDRSRFLGKTPSYDEMNTVH